MKIDRELAKEIKAVQGDKSRMAIINLKKKVGTVAAELSKPWQMGEDSEACIYMKKRYSDSFQRFKRAEIAVCTAVTIAYYNKYHLDWSDALKASSIAWANEVLSLCDNKIRPDHSDLVIKKQHGANEVDYYAKFFIELTTEDAA